MPHTEADTKEETKTKAEVQYDTSSNLESSVNATVKFADEAIQFVGREPVAIDEETNVRIRRKIDRHILPWMCTL